MHGLTTNVLHCASHHAHVPPPPDPCSLGIENIETTRQLSKKTPSLEQIRVILEACTYRGKDEEANAEQERLEKCTLRELQVGTRACTCPRLVCGGRCSAEGFSQPYRVGWEGQHAGS